MPKRYMVTAIIKRGDQPAYIANRPEPIHQGKRERLLAEQVRDTALHITRGWKYDMAWTRQYRTGTAMQSGSIRAVVRVKPIDKKRSSVT